MGYLRVKTPRFDWASSLWGNERESSTGGNWEGVPDVRILLAHTDHDTLVTGATDDGTEGLADEKGAKWGNGETHTGRRHGEHRRLGQSQYGSWTVK